VVWWPRLRCPACGGALAAEQPGWACSGCGGSFPRQGHLVRLLTDDQLEAATPFLTWYRTVRASEGFRRDDVEYYRQLPRVARHDPEYDRWRVREVTAVRLGVLLAAGGGAPRRMADLGAGSGWLSARLAAAGHAVVAVDLLDDDRDGLAALDGRDDTVQAFQADFERLPFADGEFDTVIFNGAFHYARSAGRAFGEALRVLDARGAVAIMDSPLFDSRTDGLAMLERRNREWVERFGQQAPAGDQIGFLTFDELEGLARQHGLTARFYPSRGRWRWEWRRQLRAWRRGRPSARFGLWWAVRSEPVGGAATASGA
jgi:SAM-dependent methyltransferase